MFLSSQQANTQHDLYSDANIGSPSTEHHK